MLMQIRLLLTVSKKYNTSFSGIILTYRRDSIGEKASVGNLLARLPQS